MSNFNQQLVALTLATLRADGKVDTAEIEAIKKVAADLECSADETTKLLIEENEKQAKCPDIKAYIKEVAATVEKPEDKQLIMEACTQVALADKELATKEAEILVMLCIALGGNIARMICNIATVAQIDRDIKIEGNDANYDEDEVVEVVND